MNQTEQMREALRLANRALRSWMPDTYDEKALWEYRQAISAIEQALAAEPEKLVRLSTGKIYDMWPSEVYAFSQEAVDFANAIMDAMEEVNR